MIGAENLNKNNQYFSTKFGIAGLFSTVMTFIVFVLILPRQDTLTLGLLSLFMFGAPFLISALIALLLKQPNINSLKGMTVGLLIVSILIVLFSTFTILTYSGGGANIGALMVLLLSPLYYCIGAYIGWKRGGKVKPNN